MQTVEIVNTTLDDYLTHVRNLSVKYSGEPDLWLELKASEMDDGDRDEFSFIRMAVWEKLLEKEFFSSAEPPEQTRLFEQCGTVEPGTNPGSLVLVVKVECSQIRGTHRRSAQ